MWHIFPLIALINTDIPCIRDNPCSSVVGIISHWMTSFRGYILTTELHWTTLNQEYLFALRSAQKESFEPLGEIRNLNYLNQVYLFSWDCLDLCELASKDVKFPRIRANPCPSVGHIIPTDCTNLHWYSVFPWQSVFVRGWYYLPLNDVFPRVYFDHWTTLNQEYLFALRSAQKSQLSKPNLSAS